MNKWQYLSRDLWFLKWKALGASPRLYWDWDFGCFRKTSGFFGRLRTSSGIFGNYRFVFKNLSTPKIKISRLYLRKSWQVHCIGFPTVVRVFCPVVFKIILSLAHVVFTKAVEVKIQGTAANCVKLASAIMCRFLNTEASAIHYRISTLLSKRMTKSSFGEKSERSL